MKAVLVAAAALVVAFLIGCDGGTMIDGSVKDHSGAPVDGAQVSLAWYGADGELLRSMTVAASDGGRYRVGFTHSPFRCSLSLTVEKAGYGRFEKRFYSTDHVRNFDIVLQPAQQPSQKEGAVPAQQH